MSAREAVRDRSAGLCEAQTTACSYLAAHVHHRLMRSQLGKDTPDNLLAVCRPCHDYIHAHPAESYAAGWLIRSTTTGETTWKH